MAYFEDEISIESGSDRVIVLAISIIAIGFYPVATALGTDSMTSAGFLPQIRPLPRTACGRAVNPGFVELLSVKVQPPATARAF